MTLSTEPITALINATPNCEDYQRKPIAAVCNLDQGKTTCDEHSDQHSQATEK